MTANSGPDLEVKRKEQAAPAAIDGWKYSLQSNSTVETSPMTDRHPSAILQCLDPDCQRENWSLSWLCPNMQKKFDQRSINPSIQLKNLSIWKFDQARVVSCSCPDGF
jgi:hypothetical protein